MELSSLWDRRFHFWCYCFQMKGDLREAAKGAELLVSAALLYQYCRDNDENEDGDSETLEVISYSCISVVISLSRFIARAVLMLPRVCFPRRHGSQRKAANPQVPMRRRIQNLLISW